MVLEWFYMLLFVHTIIIIIINNTTTTTIIIITVMIELKIWALRVWHFNWREGAGGRADGQTNFISKIAFVIILMMVIVDFASAKYCPIYLLKANDDSSDGHLFKNRPRASTSEYKQPPINLRLFQNTVKFLDNFFLSKKAEIRKWKKFHPDAR